MLEFYYKHFFLNQVLICFCGPNFYIKNSSEIFTTCWVTLQNSVSQPACILSHSTSKPTIKFLCHTKIMIMKKQKEGQDYYVIFNLFTSADCMICQIQKQILSHQCKYYLHCSYTNRLHESFIYMTYCDQTLAILLQLL